MSMKSINECVIKTLFFYHENSQWENFPQKRQKYTFNLIQLRNCGRVAFSAISTTYNDELKRSGWKCEKVPLNYECKQAMQWALLSTIILTVINKNKLYLWWKYCNNLMRSWHVFVTTSSLSFTILFIGKCP